MSARPALILGASLIVGCLIFGVLFAPPSAGQAPAGPAGPYQAVGVGNYLVITDPATGQSWARLIQKPEIGDDPKTAWVPLGSPIKK